jgi:hypothetical protein
MSRLQWKNKGMSASKLAEVDNYQESNALLSDIIINYRTVISFGKKNIDHLMSSFDKLLVQPKRQGIKNAHLAGIMFGYSQFIRFAYIGCVFYISTEFG